ncbi:hypothetical protein [Nostoc sp. UHCC 0252]|uniref:hypothetical protein n=1 Tax=Nostoc sp. UHCC 0252 TaxID=3110241 RepID=UPI002B2203BA|nr:hypothetical protein [Nostoc sp. UHCC 0252]MEA5603536.1 hypothetical protein [Nostoc sp. UHCC 0252]
MYVLEIRGFTDKTLRVGNWELGTGNWKLGTVIETLVMGQKPIFKKMFFEMHSALKFGVLVTIPPLKAVGFPYSLFPLTDL